MLEKQELSSITYYILGVVDVVVVAGTRCSVQGNTSHVIAEPSSLVIDDATRASLITDHCPVDRLSTLGWT